FCERAKSRRVSSLEASPVVKLELTFSSWLSAFILSLIALKKPILQVSTPFKGLEHGDFVGILQVRANSNPDADARHAHTERFQQLRQIDRRRFAFRGRIGANDDFLDRPAFQPL